MSRNSILGRRDIAAGADGERAQLFVQFGAGRMSLLVSEKLFELAGSRATLAEFNLDRHWRNARVHTLHDPVRWKYHAIGNYYLNDANPPRRGTI